MPLLTSAAIQGDAVTQTPNAQEESGESKHSLLHQGQLVVLNKGSTTRDYLGISLRKQSEQGRFLTSCSF